MRKNIEPEETPLGKLLKGAADLDADDLLKKQASGLVRNLFFRHDLMGLPHLQVNIYRLKGVRQGIGFHATSKVQAIMLLITAEGLLTLQSTDPRLERSRLEDVTNFTLMEPTDDNLQKLAKRIKTMKL